MKILIVNTDYPAYLTWLYQRNPGLSESCYDDQMRARNASLFGVADFYSSNLRKYGHEAWDVHANNEVMQAAWACEHGIKPGSNGWLKRARRFAGTTPLRHLKPVIQRFIPSGQIYDVLAAQIRHYRPDVLLNQAVDEIPDDFLWEMKPNVRLIAGQIASPLIGQRKFRSYDLMLSSLPNFVDYFRNQGIRTELHRFAFEASILPRLQQRGKAISASFVGSLSSYHSSRVRLLEMLCEKGNLSVWGQGASSLPKSSEIHNHYCGNAWGLEMYQILQDSKVTLNHHISIASNYANNMRLFEATGVGVMLVTDRKDNLHEIFEPGKEVAVYSSPEECLEVMRYYLEHDAERQAIAVAGQQRTLRQHNYEVRMQELAELLTARVAM